MEEKAEVKEDIKKPGNPMLVIELMEDGYNVKVGGCIFDEKTCFFLLEKAKDVIKAYNLRQRTPQIVPAKHGILDFAKRRKN